MIMIISTIVFRFLRFWYFLKRIVMISTSLTARALSSIPCLMNASRSFFTCKNDAMMMGRWCKDDANLMQGCKDDARLIQRWYKDDANLMEGCKYDAKIIWRWCNDTIKEFLNLSFSCLLCDGFGEEFKKTFGKILSKTVEGKFMKYCQKKFWEELSKTFWKEWLNTCSLAISPLVITASLCGVMLPWNITIMMIENNLEPPTP